jgi:hypothetical protein
MVLSKAKNPLPAGDEVSRNSALQYLQDKESLKMLLLDSNFLYQQNPQRIKWVKTVKCRIF